jgi:hypothetical protein
MAIMRVPQSVAGVGMEAAHTHAAQLHAHDHYHVSLVHDEPTAGMWAHESTWHTHEHNHSATTHRHDFARSEEDLRHDKRAHIHDHAAPTHSCA